MLRWSIRPFAWAALRPAPIFAPLHIYRRTAASAAAFPASFPSDSRGGVHSDVDTPTHMPFGKHKGVRLEDVPASYVTWLEREGALDKRPELKRAFASLGRVDDALQYDYSHLRASHLNPFSRSQTSSRSSLPPFWGAGLSFLPSEAASSAEAPAALSPEAIAALEPFREVPKSLPSNLVFFDLETVHTSNINDLPNNYIAQIGAVDGTGREFQAAVCPPVPFATVAAASSFFVEHDFQRFYKSPHDFRAGWDLFRRWLWDSAQGRARVGERARAHAPAAGEVPAGSRSLIYDVAADAAAPERPVVFIGHNMVRFDFMRVDRELRRLGSLPPPLLAAAAAAAGTSLETTKAADLRSELFTMGGVRCIDTLDVMSRFTGIESSPAKGAWALGNLVMAATGQPPAHAHDAVDDARSVRALFFADNLMGTFFRAELARQLAAADAAAEFSASYLPAIADLPGAELGLLPAPVVPAAGANVGTAAEESPSKTVPVFGYDLPRFFASATEMGFTAVVSLNDEVVATLPQAPEGQGQGYSKSGGSNGHPRWRNRSSSSNSSSASSATKGFNGSAGGAFGAAFGAVSAADFGHRVAGSSSSGPSEGRKSSFTANEVFSSRDEGSADHYARSGQDVFRGGAGEIIQPPVGHVDGDFIAE